MLWIHKGYFRVEKLVLNGGKSLSNISFGWTFQGLNDYEEYEPYQLIQR